jgi:hypothetical protein
MKKEGPAPGQSSGCRYVCFPIGTAVLVAFRALGVRDGQVAQQQIIPLMGLVLGCRWLEQCVFCVLTFLAINSTGGASWDS